MSDLSRRARVALPRGIPPRGEAAHRAPCASRVARSTVPEMQGRDGRTVPHTVRRRGLAFSRGAAPPRTARAARRRGGLAGAGRARRHDCHGAIQRPRRPWWERGFHPVDPNDPDDPELLDLYLLTSQVEATPPRSVGRLLSLRERPLRTLFAGWCESGGRQGPRGRIAEERRNLDLVEHENVGGTLAPSAVRLVGELLDAGDTRR